MKQATLLLLLFPMLLQAQDSLYIASEKPASIHEDLPLELGATIISSKPGKITHVKFYAADPGSYTISFWSVTGSLYYSFKAVATTGWQRYQLAIPFEVAAGDSYIISYLTNQKFAYTKPGIVRSAGSIAKAATRYSYGHKFPAIPTNEDYFIDVVFKVNEERKSLIVNAGPDTIYRLPKDSVVHINAVVTGDSAYYSWYIVDSAGTCQVTGLNTLSPVIRTKGPCTLIMLLSGNDKYGNFLSSPVQIDILADPKTIISTIEYYLDGTYKVIDNTNYFLMKSRTL